MSSELLWNVDWEKLKPEFKALSPEAQQFLIALSDEVAANTHGSGAAKAAAEAIALIFDLI